MTKTAQKNTKTFATMDKAIASIERRSKTLQQDIHAWAVVALGHWMRNPQDTMAVAEKLTALQEASPYHAKAFFAWMEKYSGMQWAKDTNVWSAHESAKINGKAFQEARNTPFYELKPAEAAGKALTTDMLIKMLEGALKVQAKHDKEAVEGDDYSTAGNAGINTAIKALKRAKGANVVKLDTGKKTKKAA